MPTYLKHNGGIIDVMLELGFDAVNCLEMSQQTIP